VLNGGVASIKSSGESSVSAAAWRISISQRRRKQRNGNGSGIRRHGGGVAKIARQRRHGGAISKKHLYGGIGGYRHGGAIISNNQ